MDHTPRIPLEVCVDAAADLALAAKAGVDRVELCAALPLGGLTPGPGLIAAAARCPVPCHAMIRPRPGDFLFDEADMRACLDDVAAMRAAGLAGVVIGVAQADGSLNLPALDRLVRAAGPLEVTLHRVFDLVPDPLLALEQAIELGIGRILTSGQSKAAPDGTALLRRLVARANGRIQIMAGGGVTADSAAALLATGVDALHASCSVTAPQRQAVDCIGITAMRRTDAKTIAALRAAMTSEEMPT